MAVVRLWALLSVCVGATIAQAQSVTLSLTPDSAILGAADTGSTLVIVRNTGDKPVHGLRLSLMSTDGITGTFATPAPSTLAAGDASATILRVKRTTDVVRPLAAQLRADYAGGVVVASFRIATGAYASPDQVADLQLSGGVSTVTTKDTGLVYVVVHNKTDSTIRVGPLAFASSHSLEAGVDAGARLDSGRTLTVPARSTVSVPLYLTGARQLAPGKETFVVTVPLAWTIGHVRATGDVILTRDVDVDVWGESDLLKAVGIPSFLLLPGFLMVVTFGFLWRLHKPWRAAGEFPLSGVTPEFWLFGVTLSGLFAVVASFFGVGNYLHHYDITDLAQVWLISIGVGLGAFLGVAAVGWWVDRSNAEHRRAITPTEGDGVIAVLERLARDKWPVPNTKRVIGDGNDQVFELRVDPTDTSRIWVAPQALVTWDPAAPPTNEQARDEARLPTLINQPDATVLAAFLRTYRDKRRITRIRWSTVDGHAGPWSVEAKDLSKSFRGYFVATEGEGG